MKGGRQAAGHRRRLLQGPISRPPASRAIPSSTTPPATAWCPTSPSWAGRRPSTPARTSPPPPWVFERLESRLKIAGTDVGRQLQERIDDLMALLLAYLQRRHCRDHKEY